MYEWLQEYKKSLPQKNGQHAEGLEQRNIEQPQRNSKYDSTRLPSTGINGRVPLDTRQQDFWKQVNSITFDQSQSMEIDEMETQPIDINREKRNNEHFLNITPTKSYPDNPPMDIDTTPNPNQFMNENTPIASYPDNQLMDIDTTPNSNQLMQDKLSTNTEYPFQKVELLKHSEINKTIIDIMSVVENIGKSEEGKNAINIFDDYLYNKVKSYQKKYKKDDYTENVGDFRLNYFAWRSDLANLKQGYSFNLSDGIDALRHLLTSNYAVFRTLGPKRKPFYDEITKQMNQTDSLNGKTLWDLEAFLRNCPHPDVLLDQVSQESPDIAHSDRLNVLDAPNLSSTNEESMTDDDDCQSLITNTYSDLTANSSERYYYITRDRLPTKEARGIQQAFNKANNQIQEKALETFHTLIEQVPDLQTEVWNRAKATWAQQDQLTQDWTQALWYHDFNQKSIRDFIEQGQTLSASQFETIQTNLFQCRNKINDFYQLASLEPQMYAHIVDALIQPIKLLVQKETQDSDFYYTPEERKKTETKFLRAITSDHLNTWMEQQRRGKPGDKQYYEDLLDYACKQVSSQKSGADQLVNPEQRPHDECSLANLPQNIEKIRKQYYFSHPEQSVKNDKVSLLADQLWNHKHHLTAVRQSLDTLKTEEITGNTENNLSGNRSKDLVDGQYELSKVEAAMAHYLQEKLSYRDIDAIESEIAQYVKSLNEIIKSYNDKYPEQKYKTFDQRERYIIAKNLTDQLYPFIKDEDKALHKLGMLYTQKEFLDLAWKQTWLVCFSKPEQQEQVANIAKGFCFERKFVTTSNNEKIQLSAEEAYLIEKAYKTFVEISDQILQYTHRLSEKYAMLSEDFNIITQRVIKTIENHVRPEEFHKYHPSPFKTSLARLVRNRQTSEE